MTPRNLTIAEWVLPGHPDKLCDALADRIVGEVLRVDPQAQCGIEAACAFNHVFVTGLIGMDLTTMPDVRERVDSWVRDTYRCAGYGGRWDPCPDALHIDLQALRIEQRGREWQELRHLSDDQSISIGYAQNTPDTGHIPGAAWTARRIALALHQRQQADPQGAIGPDGKVIVRGEEGEDGRFTPEAISVSLHHAPEADWLAMQRHVRLAVEQVLGTHAQPELVVNAAGMFLCGGPTGDNGTTGKKLVMDAYGPGVPIGGGAWCGKDFHKPDRVGGMVARQVALQCVQAGLGQRVQVQLDYRPNSTQPESLIVRADGRLANLPPSVRVATTWEAAWSMLTNLRASDHQPLLDGYWARWGHFGHGSGWWELAR